MRRDLISLVVCAVFMLAPMRAEADPGVQPASAVYQLQCLSWRFGRPDVITWALSGGQSTAVGVTYHTLTDRGLLKRVSLLPKGTRIEYHRSPLPALGNIGKEQDKELKAFARYCRGKGIDYEDGFPVL